MNLVYRSLLRAIVPGFIVLAGPDVSHSRSSRDFFVVDSTANTDIRDVRIVGTYGYASIGTGLLVLEVSEPGRPVVISRLNSGYTRPDHVQGHFRAMYRDGLVWVPMWAGGVLIVDVSDPARPALRGRIATPHKVREIQLFGDHLYAGTYDTGLMVYDVIDPAAPVLTGITPEARLVTRDLCVHDGFLYVAAERVYTYELTDPASPGLIDVRSEFGRAGSFLARGPFAYVTDFSAPGLAAVSGLTILDLSNPFGPVLVSSEGNHSDDLDVYVEGFVAFVANQVLGLHAVDVSRPDSPRVFSWIYDWAVSASESLIKHGAFIYESARDAGLRVWALDPRGDCNADGIINAVDVIWLVNWIQRIGPESTPPQGQVDCVGDIGFTDVIALINYIFKSGPTPACP